MSLTTTDHNQDETVADTDKEIVTPTDEVAEADDHPSEDVEDVEDVEEVEGIDGSEEKDDRAGLP